MPLSMNNRNRMIRLFDCYEGLLTDKQKTLFNYYFNEDLSLTEIAELMGTSRQAVHNSINRCESTLESYESTLGMLSRSDEVDAVLDEAIAFISRLLEGETWHEKDVQRVLSHLTMTRKAD